MNTLLVIFCSLVCILIGSALVVVAYDKLQSEEKKVGSRLKTAGLWLMTAGGLAALMAIFAPLL